MIPLEGTDNRQSSIWETFFWMCGLEAMQRVFLVPRGRWTSGLSLLLRGVGQTPGMGGGLDQAGREEVTISPAADMESHRQTRGSSATEAMGTSQCHDWAGKSEIHLLCSQSHHPLPLIRATWTQNFSSWTQSSYSFFHLRLTCFFLSLCRLGPLLPHLTVRGGHAPNSSLDLKFIQPSSSTAQCWPQCLPLPGEKVAWSMELWLD